MRINFSPPLSERSSLVAVGTVEGPQTAPGGYAPQGVAVGTGKGLQYGPDGYAHHGVWYKKWELNPRYAAAKEEANRQQEEETQRPLSIKRTDPTQYKFSKTYKPKPPRRPSGHTSGGTRLTNSAESGGQN